MNGHFYSLNEYYRTVFGQKVYKLSLDAGMTCPNRDGTIGTGGCIFCSAGGSGDFATGRESGMNEQIAKAIQTVSGKYHGSGFVAYFQSFTNTYAPVEELRSIFMETIHNPCILGISIATRPDCLGEDIIALLVELNKIKPIWVELGLQTVREDTATYIRRGYPLSVFEDAVLRLKKHSIHIIAHMIIGLPGESHKDYIATAGYIAALGIGGIKLQLLHVLQGTDLAKDYEQGLFQTLDFEEYVSTIVDIIESLPPDMVVHRITGDGPKSILIAPLWSSNKKRVLNGINKEFMLRNTFQGKEYKSWQ